MTRRTNNRLFLILAVGVLLLLTFACVLLFSDCGESSWISSGSNSPGGNDSFIDSDQGTAIDGVFAAPTFRNGSYTMLSSVSTTEDYTDGNGKVMYSYTSTTKYTYRLDITLTETGLVCKYTFVNIYGAINDNGALTIDVNTADPDSYSESVAHFYDLLGKSFTVSVDSSGSVVSLTGLDEIIKAHPETASLLNEETLFGMASDLFHPMPSTFTQGTSWVVNSYGVDNTYSVSRMSGDKFGADITGAGYSLPAPTTDAYGYTTTYTGISPITGTLWIDRNDRAVQELTTRQRSDGTISDADGYGMYFSITTSTSCAITAAEN